jgi:hypothetical protein
MLTTAAVLTASVAGALAAPSGPSLKPGQASVSVADCHPSDTVADRSASFAGQMRAVTGAKRLAMHFTLLERLGSRTRAYKPIPLSDLKGWRWSKPGARAFIYTQRVTALRDNGSYRMRVQFRWYGDGRTLLRSTSLRSRSCRQPAPLPDLTVTSITGGAVTAGRRTYSLTVANNGQGDARKVPVALKVDGVAVGSSAVDLLPGQESSVVQIAGPVCAFTVRAIADPGDRIREIDDSNNALTLPCAQVGS